MVSKAHKVKQILGSSKCSGGICIALKSMTGGLWPAVWDRYRSENKRFTGGLTRLLLPELNFNCMPGSGATVPAFPWTPLTPSRSRR